MEAANSHIVNSSRDEIRDQFGSFRSAYNLKSFNSKPKISQNKPKSKKRSRNRNVYQGTTNSQSKYHSKVMKNSMHEGICSQE